MANQAAGGGKQEAPPQRMAIGSAEVLLPSRDIAADIAFWTSHDLGFRMDQIYPADDPQVVAISGHGIRLRLDKSSAAAASTIRLLYDGPNLHREHLTSPSGTRVEFVPYENPFPLPPTQHAFTTRRLRDNAPWVIGRAGMHYRDLIPSRLGGSIIASHIRIPHAGPVPDNVHYHTVGFQLIFCHAGWVRVIYEDQGPAFVMRAGDCVIQPPKIRHRVLESSDELQVVEVGVPAEHLTTLDHTMELPTPEYRPEREWDGQRFVRSCADDAVWEDWRIPGFEARDTGVRKGTKGVASVHVARPRAGKQVGGAVTSHDSNILFAFVLTGSCVLRAQDRSVNSLVEGDAYTLPPGYMASLNDCSEDFSVLEVALPGHFKTTVHTEVQLA